MARPRKPKNVCILQTIKPQPELSTACVALLDYPLPLNHLQYGFNRRNIVAVYFHDMNYPFGLHATTTNRSRELRIFKTYDAAMSALFGPELCGDVASKNKIIVMTDSHPTYEVFLERTILIMDRIYPFIHVSKEFA